jgi:hypothetical protein
VYLLQLLVVTRCQATTSLSHTPEEAKPARTVPVPLMSLEVAPPPELKQDEEKPAQEAPQVLQLPRAHEEALAYKSERAEVMGIGPDTVASFSQMAKQSPTKTALAPGGKLQLVAEDEDDESDRKEKQKQKKKRPEMWARQADKRWKEEEERVSAEPDEEVEYIQEQLDLDALDPMYRTFNKIFQLFKIVNPAEEKAMREEEVCIFSCNSSFICDNVRLLVCNKFKS